MHSLLITLCSSLLFSYSIFAMDKKPIDQPEEKKRNINSLDSDERRHGIVKSSLKVDKQKRQARSLSPEPIKIDQPTIESNIEPIKNHSPKPKRSFFSIHHKSSDPEDQRMPRTEKRQTRAASSSPANHKKLDLNNKLASSDPSVYGHPKLSPKKSPKKQITSSHPVIQKNNTSHVIDFMTARNAIQVREIDCIREYLRDEKNDPNKKDMYGNTLLHFIVLQTINSTPEDADIYEILNLYLRNPHTDIFTKDNSNRTAFEYIDKDNIAKYQKTYDVLKKHKDLTHIIYAILIIKTKLTEKNCNREIITKKVEKIYKKIPRHKISNYATIPFITSMIEHCLSTDRQVIKIIYDQYQKNPNYQDDEWGNTLCHLAAYICDKKLIKQLTANPYIICDLKNKEGNDPRSLLDNLRHESLRTKLFNNVQSHKLIDQAIDTAYLRYPMIKYAHVSEKTDDYFIKIKEIFLELAQEIEDSQNGSNDETKDRALPKKSMLIPSDEFLLAAIIKHMETKKIALSEQILTYSENFNPNPSDEESSGTITQRMKAKAAAASEQKETDLSSLNLHYSDIESSQEIDIKDMMPAQTISIDLKQKK